MPEFSVNAQRRDPYKNFSFKVRWDGEYVAGFSKVSALKRTTGVVKYRSGGDPSHVHLAPGQVGFDAVTLERGVTHDPAFEQWANKIWFQPNPTGDGELSLADFRKDIVIEMYNAVPVPVTAEVQLSLETLRGLPVVSDGLLADLLRRLAPRKD